MTLLVFGKSGQVASELARLVPDAVFLARQDVDLEVAGACASAIRHLRPTKVINAAAYTQVDKAEAEPDLARAINADAPGEIARACADGGIPLVHISTDYVFDGLGTAPRLPSDPTAPLNVYGKTKRDGEVLVRESGATHVILRTSWVFSAAGSNFLKTMLRLSETRDQLSIVADQIGGPTPASAIASGCLKIVGALGSNQGKSGTYHFTGAPDCTWAEFAEEIFKQAGRPVEVTRISSSDYPTPARRPQNSRLDCRSTLDTFGLRQPDWRDGVAQVLKELGVIAG